MQLARVLAQLHGQPPARTVLFLDEPTSALDLRHQHAIMAVAHARAAAGCTVVAVLHDLMLAGAYADRLLVLGKGRRVAEGPAAEVLTPEVAGRAYGLRVRRVPDAGRIILVPDAEEGPRLAPAAE